MAHNPSADIATRRNAKRGSKGPSIYNACLDALKELGPHNLAAHDYNVTFTRDAYEDDRQQRHFLDYHPKDSSKMFTAHLVAQIGSQSDGTHMAAYPEKIFASKLPLKDDSANVRMVLALREPVGAPPALVKHFRYCMAVVEAIPNDDAEKEGDEKFDKTDWTSRSDGKEDEPCDVMLVRLPPTYETPKTRPTASSTPVRPRNAKTPPPGDHMETDSTNKDTPTNERQIGDKYHPDVLSDHRGDYFSHKEAKVVQRDIRNVDGELIAPGELYTTLTEGTLVSVQISMHTYIWPANTPRGYRSKIYHIYVERIRILDPGFGEAWNPPIPQKPVDAGPSTPTKRRAEHDADAASAFDVFNSVSPVKRSRR